MTDHRSLLLLYAHPDDESFGAAGAVASCKAAGGRVALVTATRGERGTRGTPPVCAPEELPAVRERELREASRIIGVDELTLLPYHDKQLAEAPAAEVRSALVRAIRRHRPQVVITFDPNGLTAHPDHVAISRFTADAVSVAADPRWEPELGEAHRVGRVVWPSPVFPWEFTGRESLAASPGVDVILDIDRWRDVKAAALRAHRTQQAVIEPRFFAPNVAYALRFEAFRLGAGAPFRERPAADLFADLEDVATS